MSFIVALEEAGLNNKLDGIVAKRQSESRKRLGQTLTKLEWGMAKDWLMCCTVSVYSCILKQPTGGAAAES